MHKSFEYKEGYEAYGDGDTFNPYEDGGEACDDWNDGFQAAKDDDYEHEQNMKFARGN